jgi:diacylglycerol kinase (ATP)
MSGLVVILNPASGGGRLRKSISRIQAAFARFSPEYLVTTTVGEEEGLARDAADAGADTIVLVGGDGTWGNAVHGIVSTGARPRVALLAAGTGNDFVKSVGAPAHDPATTAQLVEAGAERRVDVGQADDRVFLNCLGIGFDTAVLARSYSMRRLQGPVRYLAAAIAELFTYRSRSSVITPWPGTDTGDALLTVIANGSWYGGMFHIAPHARPDDGMLDAIRVSDVRGLRRLSLLAAAVSGGHVKRRDVQLASGAEFSLAFETPPMLNLDGELRLASAASVSVRVLPRALRLVAPLRPGDSQ